MSSEVAELERPVDDLPEGWRALRLGDVATLSGGTTPSRAETAYWEGATVPWATPSDITSLPTGSNRIADTEAKVTDKALAECSLTLNLPGTVLMTSRATIGFAAINQVPMATNQGFITFRAGQNLDADFLLYWLTAQRNDLVAAAGGSTFKELSRGTAKLLPILLPPLDEQRRIAEVLRSVDEAIASKSLVFEQTRTILSRVRDSLIQATALSGCKIPEGWRLATLGEVSVGKGEYGANVSKRDFDAMLPRYVRITDIADDGELIATSLASITPEDAAGYMLEEGDLLFARSGATVGKTFLYDPKYGPCAYAGYLIRFKIDRERADPFFVRSAVQTSHYCEWINTNQRAQAQPNVNAKEYASFPIPLPPLEQQQEIVETLRSLQEGTNQAKFDLEKASRLKAALMSDLLSGRVRVPA